MQPANRSEAVTPLTLDRDLHCRHPVHAAAKVCFKTDKPRQEAHMTRHSIVAVLILMLIATPLLAADAAALYKTKCFACHGEKGVGDTVMGKKLGVRNLGSAAVQAQNDAALTAIITNGKQKMPAYSGKIPDTDIKGLVAHIRTFAAK